VATRSPHRVPARCAVAIVLLLALSSAASTARGIEGTIAPASTGPGVHRAVHAFGSSAQTPARSLWDGVYVAEQAARGQAVVARHCGYCHGDGLTGADDPPGPPLKGQRFLDRWFGRSLADLFVVIGVTMPRDDPGSLSLEEYADILGFVLRENGFPAGDTPLPATVEGVGALKAILIQPEPKR